MKKKIFLFIVVSFFMGFPAQAQVIKPGIWKAQASLKISGIPLPQSNDEECISAKEAKDAKTTIVKELKKQGCSVNKWVVKAGKLNASLSCKNDDIDAQGSLRGQFSDQSYDLEGEAEGTYKNAIPSSATLKLVGRWIKACAK